MSKAGGDGWIYSPTAPHKAFDSVGEIVPVQSLYSGRPEYRLALGLTRATDLDGLPDIVRIRADLLGRQAQKYARAQVFP